VIVLTMITTAAAAWWAVEHLSSSSDKLQDEVTVSPAPQEHPAVVKQGNSITSPNEQKSAEGPADNSMEPAKTIQKHHTKDIRNKESSIVYKREVF